MVRDDWTALNDAWRFGSGCHSATSPAIPDRLDQILLHSKNLRHGSIAAKIRPLKGLEQHWGTLREAALVFRYNGKDDFFIAGLGGFGAKFFIGRVQPGPVWSCLASEGDRDAVEFDRAHRLRLRFSGNLIQLFSRKPRPLYAFSPFEGSSWGLRALGTKTRFSEVRFRKERPLCFVAMPFESPDSDAIHEVVQDAAHAVGAKCKRADENLSGEAVRKIEEDIQRADLVIADLRGKNPNVYWEIGFAQALRKPLILLSRSRKDATFNVQRHLRIEYRSLNELSDPLTEAIKGEIKKLEEGPRESS